MALRATEMNEDAGAVKHETGSAGDLVAGVLQGSESSGKGATGRLLTTLTPVFFKRPI